MPLGQLMGGAVISFIYKWDLALIAVGIAFVFVLPACIIQVHTVQSRAHLLADAYGAASGFSAEVLGAIRTKKM